MFTIERRTMFSNRLMAALDPFENFSPEAPYL
jgi:hypothetical protein